MTTASKITLARIALIPVFMAVILNDFPYSNTIGLILFAIASITDSVDGYVARKYNQVSTFGKFVDPLADKLLVTAAILIFVEWGQMPSWAATIIIAREFAVTTLRLVAVDSGVIIAAGFSGKLKTVVTLIGICIMFTGLQSMEIIPGFLTVNGLCVTLIVIVTVLSGVEYFIKNWKLFDLRK